MSPRINGLRRNAKFTRQIGRAKLPACFFEGFIHKPIIKRCLFQSSIYKALPVTAHGCDNRATSERNSAMTEKHKKGDGNRELAAKIAAAISASPLSAKEIAEACGVTPQAINGWKTTGRISKEMLVDFAKVVKVPLAHFISNESPAAHPQRDFPRAAGEAGLLMLLFLSATDEGKDLILSVAERVPKKPGSSLLSDD
jgi:transcriptional regulator with XRE-family HTH domain